MHFFGPPIPTDSSLYSINELKTRGEFKELIEGHFFMLKKVELWDGEPGPVSFAFFNFHSGTDTDTEVELLMHGTGLSGALRECRHTYWGDEEGYVFYPNGKHFKAIFQELAVYFDDME